MSPASSPSPLTKNPPRPIFIVDDDPVMADCIKSTLKQALLQQSDQPTSLPEIKIFADAVATIEATNAQIPGLILLDVLLTGPNGFTLLNELASYPETAQIPVALMSSLDLRQFPLAHYNIVRIFTKETMTPVAIAELVQEYYA